MEPITLAMLAGQGLSALGNIFGADSERDAARAQANAYLQSIQRQEGLAREGAQQAQELYQPYADLAPQYLSQLQSGIDSGEFTSPDMGEFQYDQTVQDFLDPSMQYQQQVAQDALEQSAAARGGLSSGSTLRALQNQAQDYAMQDYGNASNRMQQDKQFNYQDWTNHFNNQAQQAQDRYNQISSMFNVGMGGVNQIGNAQQGLNQSLMGAESQRGTVMANKAGLNDQFNAQLMGTIGNTLGKMGGTAMMANQAPTMPTLPQLPNAYSPTTNQQTPNLYMAQNLNPSLMPQGGNI